MEEILDRDIFLFSKLFVSFPGVGGEAVWVVLSVRGPGYLGCWELRPMATYICIEKSPPTHSSTSNFFIRSPPTAVSPTSNLLAYALVSFLFPPRRTFSPKPSISNVSISQTLAKSSFLGDIHAKSKPQTESAREARKSFYCELCGKGYSRMNEFETHEGSYDHLHKKVGGASLLFVR